jgi:hypothetical protein
LANETNPAGDIQDTNASGSETPKPDSVSDLAKWSAENKFRERELAIKEAELQLKRTEQKGSGWSSPLVVAILAATLAGIGNAVIAIVNGNLQRDLEDRKAEQARILEMIKTGDADKAAANLDFLLQSGLISDPVRAAKLQTFLKSRKPGTGPNLPSPSVTTTELVDEGMTVSSLQTGNPVRLAAEAVGFLEVVEDGSSGLRCTAFLISEDSAMTAGYCVQNMKSGTLVFDEGSESSTRYPVSVLETSENGDYGILRVDGKPGRKRGFLKLASRAPKAGELLAIVMFRGGDNPREVVVTGSSRCKVGDIEEDLFQYDCSTRGGSAGSPLLSASGAEVLGLHLRRLLNGPSAVGVRSDSIRRRSHYLR